VKSGHFAVVETVVVAVDVVGALLVLVDAPDVEAAVDDPADVEPTMELEEDEKEVAGDEVEAPADEETEEEEVETNEEEVLLSCELLPVPPVTAAHSKAPVRGPGPKQ